MKHLWISIRDLAAVTKALLLVTLAAIILGFVIFHWLDSNFELPSDDNLRVKYMEQYVDLVQVITVGVAVTLVSVIIPLMLPESRDRFERYKESRQAYSRAKTAVIYLPDRVADVDREKAFKLVEEAHRELHLAEVFEDVIIRKGYLKWFANPHLWILYNYWPIFAVAEVLRKTDWSVPGNNKDMLRKGLRVTLEVTHNRFGTRGEYCKQEKWDIDDGSEFREEGELEKRSPRLQRRGLKKLSRFSEEAKLEKRIMATL